MLNVRCSRVRLAVRFVILKVSRLSTASSHNKSQRRHKTTSAHTTSTEWSCLSTTTTPIVIVMFTLVYPAKRCIRFHPLSTQSHLLHRYQPHATVILPWSMIWWAGFESCLLRWYLIGKSKKSRMGKFCPKLTWLLAPFFSFLQRSCS